MGGISLYQVSVRLRVDEDGAVDESCSVVRQRLLASIHPPLERTSSRDFFKGDSVGKRRQWLWVSSHESDVEGHQAEGSESRLTQCECDHQATMLDAVAAAAAADEWVRR